MALNWNEEQTRRRMLAVPVAYFFFYLLYFTLLQEYARPKFWVYTELDAYIPFFEGFVIPYVLWFPLVPLMFPYFHRRDPESYVYLCRTILTGLTLCLLIYTVLPNGQLLRRPLPRDNILCQLVALIRKTDPPINVCPSIHVFVSATIGIAAARAGSLREHKAVRRGILTLTILICMSTMFLKQHSAVDVVCGLILSVVLDLLVRRWNPGLGLLRLVVRPRAGGRTVMET